MPKSEVKKVCQQAFISGREQEPLKLIGSFREILSGIFGIFCFKIIGFGLVFKQMQQIYNWW